eukprot:TRINITY_DN100384_c0_g1_i1.p2 TRINITY_DN100384_c0_g1~~TRINITY_DN100384_c0_g1_i1.p2  ORF type:complete len:209 (+),score=68.76 TRINITY_DN100384_c0_g1_i1:73-699(+)
MQTSAWARRARPSQARRPDGSYPALSLLVAAVVAVGVSVALASAAASLPSRSFLQASGPRRQALAASVVGGLTAASSQVEPAMAKEDLKALWKELKESRNALVPLPKLLGEQEWDKVRTVLGFPPVALLWQLGPSRNTLKKLGTELGDVDMLETMENIQDNLSKVDNIAYDNSFVYTQPGAGKFNIKEPQEVLQETIKKLDQLLASAA